MATVLTKHNQWLQPDIPFDDIPDKVNIITNIDDVNALSDNFISELIAHELGSGLARTFVMVGCTILTRFYL